ncbi:MAG: putative cobaltochelatase [Desulfobacca sp.]|nr:putative cobaltochelatase [Desulfobacca sp.]
MFNIAYPFAAIIGQDRLKRALILNAVNPAVGGVLIRGEKGTAKSTAVRALAAVLPRIKVVKGCPYACDPDQPWNLCPYCRHHLDRLPSAVRRVRVVTLPLNATEDRVAGGIDFSRAVKTGRRIFQPGLLAQAHRGILYVDEVNLLDDHLVDIILDAAASGRNLVEREGISYIHPCQFILVGTMNPEEGELRPQLLDRFGLCVEIVAEADIGQRAALMQLREAYDTDPQGFSQRFQPENDKIANEIQAACQLLPNVSFPPHLRTLVSEICIENHVAGHRADLVIEQAARALAALLKHHEVTVDDIREVASLALVHRQRHLAPPPPPPEPDHDHQPRPDHQPEQNLESNESPRPDQPESQAGSRNPEPEEISPDDQAALDRPAQDQHRRENAVEQIFAVGETFKVKKIASPRDRIRRRGSGRRSRTRIAQKQGRYVKSTTVLNTGDIALDATLRAAAPYQRQRTSGNGLAVVLKPEDLREKIREKRIGNFLLFLVDASGSMGARGRMTASKGAIMSLLLDAYQKRDRIAMVSFRHQEAVVNLPPTASIELAAHLLQEMPVGGRTPLSAGLAKTYELIRNYLLRECAGRPIVIIITDGKANVALGQEKPKAEALALAGRLSRDERLHCLVVDTESRGLVQFGLARELAAALQAEYFRIEDLKADTLVNIVKENVK